MLVCFWLGGRASEVVFATLAVAFPVALAAVGASRRGRLGPLAVPLVALLVILEASVLAMLALRGRLEELPWLWGLPLPAAIELYGMWLLPLALVALAYALTFDSFTLRADDLERLRRFGHGTGESETGESATGEEG